MAVTSWLVDSLHRIYPATPCPAAMPALRLDLARQERGSFQVAVRHDRDWGHLVTVRVELPAASGLAARVRYVGYVPVRNFNASTPADELEGTLPGFVPDPLFPTDTHRVPVNETHAFWISLAPAATAGGETPGRYRIDAVVEADGVEVGRHALYLTVHDLALQPRQNFDILQWFYNDALLDFHGCDGFDERYWSTILPNYLRNLVEHGQNGVYVPVFTPPLDGVKRPTQLLRVTQRGGDEALAWDFDWTDVRRYLKICLDCGIDCFEWTHLFTQWGVRHAIRIYHDQGRDERLLWPADTGATSPTYRAFLGAFLPAFKAVLEEEGVMARSYFHVSDEPHAEHLPAYQAARGVLRELAPWMQVIDALSSIEFGRQGLTDMPIPVTSTALQFVEEGIPCWVYYCCSPRGRFIQRLMDTPLAKVRMNGCLFYRWPFLGFLHWGYNYWYKCQSRQKIDPFAVQDAGNYPSWAYGDTFVVYPGADGPIDSIRWEVFAESLQDYALFQTLGVERDDPRLAACRSLEDFPKSADWLIDLRSTLLGEHAERQRLAAASANGAAAPAAAH